MKAPPRERRRFRTPTPDAALRPRRATESDAAATRRFGGNLPHFRRPAEAALVGQEEEPDIRVALRQLDDLVVAGAHMEPHRRERIVDAEHDRLLVAVDPVAQR